LRGVWIPKDAAEVEDAARRGDLEETHIFDAKAALPQPKKNRDLAEDVAAMAVDGGVLLYGLGEDGNKRLTVLSPIVLQGARERIAQIVQTSISEPPFIRIQALEKADSPSKGYLVVIVPQSPRAPHQVVSSGDLRFYGRGSTGNRILSQGEVAGLYARRERWEVDRDTLLDKEIARAPKWEPDLGYLVAYARPVVPDDSMVERVAADGQELLAVLMEGARSWGDVRVNPRWRTRQFGPDLRRDMNVWRRGAEGWTISTTREDQQELRYTARLEVDFDGTAHIFCGRVVENIDSGSGVTRRVLFEQILAGNLASAFAAMGALFDAAGYAGNVDVGMVVLGLHGSVSSTRDAWPGEVDFTGPDPRRTARFPAAELRDDPKGVTLQLVGRLLEVVHRRPFAPFDEPEDPN
jgi:Schlafen, AlbA_2